MTKSLTPSITITQTGGAQLVIITPSVTFGGTPNIGMALAAETQTVILKP